VVIRPSKAPGVAGEGDQRELEQKLIRDKKREKKTIEKATLVGLMGKLKEQDEDRELVAKVEVGFEEVVDSNVEAMAEAEVEVDEPDQPRQLEPVVHNPHTGFELTLQVFRDLDHLYPFLRPALPPTVQPGVARQFWVGFASKTQAREDVLEAWHRGDWSKGSQEEAQVVEALLASLPQYSYTCLASITYNLPSLAHLPAHLAHLVAGLDHHLALRMRQVVAEPGMEQVEMVLQVCYMWLRCMRALGPAGRRHNRHNSAALRLLLGERLPELLPRHLVAALTLAGLARKLPGLTGTSSGQDSGTPLSPALHAALALALPALTPREVGAVSLALHRCNLHLETQHAEVRRSLLHTLCTFPTSSIQRDQFTVASLCKFLHKRGSESHSAVVTTMARFRPHLGELDVLTKVRLLQLVATGFCGPEETRGFLEDLCSSCLPHLPTDRVKDLEKLASSLFYLNQPSVSRWFLPAVAAAMPGCAWGHAKAGLSSVYLTTCLARAGLPVEDSMDRVLVAANATLPSLPALELDTDAGVAAAIPFLFHLNVSGYRRVSQGYTRRLVASARARCRNTLLQVLELDCIRELEGRQGVTPLHPGVRQQLCEFFHQGEQGVTVRDLTDSTGKVIFSDFNDMTKNFVQRDLETILGGEEMLWRGHAFPHSTKPDIFYLLDRRGRPAPLPSGFQCYGEEGVRRAAALAPGRLQVVLVPGKHDEHFQGHRHGPMAYKARHLASLGYQVQVVPWLPYWAALKARSNLAFLRRTLGLTGR